MDNKYFAPTIGRVVSTHDPAQLGRLKVVCSAWDEYQDHPLTQSEIDDMAPVEYAGPFLGQIENISSGPNKQTSWGPTGYGFWAIPKVGALVLVQCIDGNPERRVWTHCIQTNVNGNRGLPGGRGYEDGTEGPFTDSYQELEPGYSNLREAGLDKGDHYHTRGGYERQAAQAKTDKDGTEGYGTNPSSGVGHDPQTYCITTPGHHFISLQDQPDFCRVRVKTNKGHQVILDDTNERIYLSTAKGKTYLEFDEDGHIHLYGQESISIRTEGDFNVRAEGSINLNSAKDINLLSEANVNFTGIDINTDASGSIFETAGGGINIKAGGQLLEQGSQIHLNGPSPAPATKATPPEIKPEHEPWDRPPTKGSRGPDWRP